VTGGSLISFRAGQGLVQPGPLVLYLHGPDADTEESRAHQLTTH